MNVTNMNNASDTITEEQLKKWRKQVKLLQKRPQPAQRTQEWFLARNTRITASEVASCLFKTKDTCEPYVQEFGITNFKYKDSEGLNSYESREDYIIKKCASYFGENVFKDTVFTLWGKKYEEVANRLYCQINNTSVIEFGLLEHPKIKWIAASPDGITPDGIMLEIKCPKSRKIVPSAPPIYYWTQLQWQLETCNLDICDFLECEIVELVDEHDFFTKPVGFKQDKGIIVMDNLNSNGEGDPKYIYPPVEIRTAQEYIDWKNELCKSERKRYTPVYYFINKYNIIRVRRDREWFENVKNDIKRTWDLVTTLQSDKEDYLKYKESIHRIKSKKFYDKYEETDCDIHDDDSTFVLDTYAIQEEEPQPQIQTQEPQPQIQTQEPQPQIQTQEPQTQQTSTQEPEVQTLQTQTEDYTICLID